MAGTPGRTVPWGTGYEGNRSAVAEGVLSAGCVKGSVASGRKRTPESRQAGHEFHEDAVHDTIALGVEEHPGCGAEAVAVEAECLGTRGSAVAPCAVTESVDGVAGIQWPDRSARETFETGPILRDPDRDRDICEMPGILDASRAGKSTDKRFTRHSTTSSGRTV